MPDGTGYSQIEKEVVYGMRSRQQVVPHQDVYENRQYSGVLTMMMVLGSMVAHETID